MATALILICALGCGVIAGFFFAFSVCVMRALARLVPAQGAAAMRSINIVVINPWFLSVFFGIALACLGAMALALLQWEPLRGSLLLAGGALYLVGTIFVTMRFNVPRNDRLAAAPDDAALTGLWADYVLSWTAWNHVRTVAALAAAILFTAALAAG